MKIVYIEWVDSTRLDGWNNKETIKKNGLSFIKSIGYLIKKNNKKVTICHSNGSDEMLGILHIPKGCIKKIKIIKT